MGQHLDHRPHSTTTEPASQIATIAVLIRNADRLPEALRTGERLCLAGMNVAIFIIDFCRQSSNQVTCEELACRLGINAECFSCHPADAQRFGFNTASVQQMAGKITGADLVLSF